MTAGRYYRVSTLGMADEQWLDATNVLRFVKPEAREATRLDLDTLAPGQQLRVDGINPCTIVRTQAQ